MSRDWVSGRRRRETERAWGQRQTEQTNKLMNMCQSGSAARPPPSHEPAWRPHAGDNTGTPLFQQRGQYFSTLSLPCSLSLSPSTSLYPAFSLSFSLSIPLSLSLSLSLSFAIFPAFSLFLSLSLSLSLSLHPSLPMAPNEELHYGSAPVRPFPEPSPH